MHESNGVRSQPTKISTASRLAVRSALGAMIAAVIALISSVRRYRDHRSRRNRVTGHRDLRRDRSGVRRRPLGTRIQARPRCRRWNRRGRRRVFRRGGWRTVLAGDSAMGVRGRYVCSLVCPPRGSPDWGPDRNAGPDFASGCELNDEWHR
jgi:hypothetical protein